MAKAKAASKKTCQLDISSAILMEPAFLEELETLAQKYGGAQIRADFAKEHISLTYEFPSLREWKKFNAAVDIASGKKMVAHLRAAFEQAARQRRLADARLRRAPLPRLPADPPSIGYPRRQKPYRVFGI